MSSLRTNSQQQDLRRDNVASVILTEDELQALTGYKRPQDRVDELQRQGFYRARRAPSDGSVILERAHYDAICAGARKPAEEPRLRPRLARAAR